MKVVVYQLLTELESWPPRVRFLLRRGYQVRGLPHFRYWSRSIYPAFLSVKADKIAFCSQIVKFFFSVLSEKLQLYLNPSCQLSCAKTNKRVSRAFSVKSIFHLGVSDGNKLNKNTKHFRLPARGIKVIHEQNDR